MHCKNCGKVVGENDRFCTNCGSQLNFEDSEFISKEEKSFWRHGWFTILMLLTCFPVGVILVFINHPKIIKTFVALIVMLIAVGFFVTGGCHLDVEKSVPYKTEQGVRHSDEKRIENKQAYNDVRRRTAASSRIIKKPVGLPDQIYFGYNLYDFKVAYEHTDNKVQKSAVKDRQAKFLKGYFSNNKLESWRGIVKEIGSVENGRFASIDIQCDIDGMTYKMATEKFNVKLSGKQTLISKDTELYKKVMSLQCGDIVEFSAKVIPNKESGLYLENWFSEELSVSSPVFIVQFIDIKR